MKLFRGSESSLRLKLVSAFYAVALALFLTGCETTNFVSQFYTDYTAGVPKDVINARVLPYSGNTIIRSSSNPKADGTEMIRNNYVKIGESGFTGTNITLTNEMILEQARKVNADVALYYSGYVGSEQGTRPVLNYNPGQTSTTTSYGNVNANAYGTGGYAYGSANYTGTSTTNTMGTLSVSHVPATLHRYQYAVAFYRKGTPAIFGALTANLSDELRKKYGRNTGAVISTVMYNTPAFKAEFFEGDVIIAMNGQDVSSMESYGEKLIQFAGQDCVFTVLRDKERLTIPVKLNSRGAPNSRQDVANQSRGIESNRVEGANARDNSNARYTNTSPGISSDEDARERRLRSLMKMRDSKLISEEEYQQMRKKVLDEI